MLVNLEALPIGDNAPTLVNIVVEVPEDDPRFADIKSLDDLPDQNLSEIKDFFEVYKRLEGDKDVEIHGWLSLEDTQQVIRDSAH